jgi:hypothetical protein
VREAGRMFGLAAFGWVLAEALPFGGGWIAQH